MSYPDDRDSGLIGAIFTESGTQIRLLWQVIQGFLIFASCLSMLLENYEPYAAGFPGFISTLEVIAIGFFTIDYLGNLYCASNRLAYLFGFWGLVDIISILPTFLLMLNPTSTLMLKGLRALRFVRLLRLLRLGRAAF